MNPLDIVLAGLFEMLGYTNNTPPDAPKLDGSERFDAKGQTSTTSKSGKTRNFQNPRITRPPTLDPLPQRGTLQATPPNRPPGGFGQAPGQMNLDPLRQVQIPTEQMKAPNVPAPKPGKSKPAVPQYGPTSLPNSVMNNLWLLGRKTGLRGPVGGMNLGQGSPSVTPGKAVAVQAGLVGLNRLIAQIPGLDAEVKQRLDDAVRELVPGGELLAPQAEQYGPPDSLNVPPVTPVQEPIKPSGFSPDNNFGTADPKDTFKPKPNPSQAPIRSNRTKVSRYDNIGAESVSPNRGDLRPNVFAR